MTVQLYFVPQLFPRTTTRKEWYEIWRWKRVTQKALAAELEKHREVLAKQYENLLIYGTTHPEMHRDFIERMINPPLLIHDKMKL